MNSDVTLNPYIVPICLPQTENVNEKILASGFGTTGFSEKESDDLLKVTLDLFTPNECDAKLGSHGRVKQGVDYKAMFCAGSKDNRDKDTCNVSLLLNYYGES